MHLTRCSEIFQVSLLAIILEQADKGDEAVAQSGSDSGAGNGESVLSISGSTQKLVEAVGGLISAGERQSQAMRDEELTEQMAAACEVLTLASDNLFIQAHRYELQHSAENVKYHLCQAAKEVLQGVLKMLLASDDFHVRQLLEKTDSLLNLVRTVEDIKDKPQLISTFKSITYAVLAFKVELARRCQNLCSQSCRDEIMIWAGVLQNSIPSLSKASQTYLKYGSSISAKGSRDSVLQEIVEACKRIRHLLLSGSQDEDNITSFVSTVDKVVENLSEVNRGTLHPDTDSDIVFLIRHSMSVVHCASGVYRQMIVAACHRILQSKFRLLELDAALKEKPTLVQIRSEFEHICEVVLDDVCDLEKHVTLTLVQLIIETFLCPLDELARLKDAAGRQSKNKQNAVHHENVVAEFSEYTEKLCQVSLLVAASSADTGKVREIATSVRCLESLEPDVAPAIVALRKEPKSQGARTHLKLLLERWAQEVGSVVDAVDSLVDPEVFMDMTEQILTNEVETFKTMFGCSHREVQKNFNRFVRLSERPAVLARKLVDENSDPVYRNGLNYFIKLLFQRIREAERVNTEIMQTADPPVKQFDTVERRMTLVVKAVRMLREGFDAKNHPRLLSAKRMISKHPATAIDPKLVGEASHKGKHVTVKSQLADTEVKDKQPEEHDTDGKNRQSRKSNTEVRDLQLKDVCVGTENSASSLNANEDTSLPKHSEEPHKIKTQASFTVPEIFTQKENEEGPARNIYHVAKTFLEACINQDHKEIESMTHNLLRWTNHIVENAEKLTQHCALISKTRDLQELQRRLEHVTPEMIQKAKVIRAGGQQDVRDLQQDVLEWARLVNSARLIVDVTVDRWLVLTYDLQRRLEEHNEHQLKILMSTISRVQKDMCQLLTTIQSLSGKYIENGVPKIEYLTDMRNEIENLALTIKTTVDVAVVSANKAEDVWWQLALTCRDWAVAMSCVWCQLDLICSRMELVARERFRGLQNPAAKRTSQLVNVLEEETDCMLELVDCVTVGDNTLKSRSQELVAGLHAALSDLLAIAKLPATTAGTSLEDLFNSLSLRLAVSKWVEKATIVQDLVRNNCYEYFGFTHQLLLHVQEILLNEELQDAVKKKERSDLTCVFLERSQDVKQQVLRAIQLCPELPRRVVVRSSLDTLSELTAQIEGVLRTTPKLSDADVNCLSQQWAARMKKVVFNLQKMDGLDPSVLLEIENSNKATFGLYSTQSSQQHKQHQPHYISPRQQHKPQQTQHISPRQQQTAARHQQLQQTSPRHGPVFILTPQPGLLQSHPSACNQELSLQVMPGKSHAGSSSAAQGAGNLLSLNAPALSRNERSDDYSLSAKGSIVDVVLSDAKYLDSRLKLWHGDDGGGLPGPRVQRSKVIQSALDMARLCSEIALFTRGQGSLQDSEEVIGAAVAIVRQTSVLEDFGRTLWSLAGVGRGADNLEMCITKIGTCASQLHIISSTLHNSAKSYQGDRILMRNTLNLLMAVRQMFSLAEALAVKGVKGDHSGDEMIKDVLRLLQAIRSENEQYIRNERRTGKTDDLGLRRVEQHVPPALASLLDVGLV